MDESKTRAMRIAIISLFVIYAIPVVLVALSAMWTKGWEHNDLVLNAFIGFTQNQDSSLVLLQRAILPLMGAFAPFAFRGSHTDRWATVLMIILLVTIALTLAMAAVFNAAPIQRNLGALGLFNNNNVLSTHAEDALAFKDGMVLIQSFFNRIQESLGIYLLLLFGLKAAERTS